MTKKIAWTLVLISTLGFGLEASASAPIITYSGDLYCNVFETDTDATHFAQGTGLTVNWTGGRSVSVEGGFLSQWNEYSDGVSHWGQFSANHVQVTQGAWTLNAFYRSDRDSWVSYELYTPSQLAEVALYGVTVSNAKTGQTASFDYMPFDVDSTTGAIQGTVQVDGTTLAIIFREFQLAYDNDACSEAAQVDTHLNAFLIPQK